MITIILVVLLILLLASLFYRPLGTGYYSYTPSLLLFIVALVVLLWALGVLHA